MLDITADELSVEILDIVNNNMFSFNDVIQALDEGMGIISFSVLLPRLQASADVSMVVGTNVTALPSGYQRNLFYCYSTLQDKSIRIFDKKADIVRYYGNPLLPGEVQAVAVFGELLYYQGIPFAGSFLLQENGDYLLQENGDKIVVGYSVDTLTIDYYKHPTTISKRTDTFTCLPPYLIRPLLVNYASKKLFEMLEQGKEDNKNNSTYYAKLFSEALETLRAAYPPEKHRG